MPEKNLAKDTRKDVEKHRMERVNAWLHRLKNLNRFSVAFNVIAIICISTHLIDRAVQYGYWVSTILIIVTCMITSGIVWMFLDNFILIGAEWQSNPESADTRLGTWLWKEKRLREVFMLTPIQSSVFPVKYIGKLKKQEPLIQGDEVI